MKKEIILLSCWPRSGGTLLNKILVNSEEIIMLSELNLKYKSNDERYTIKWQLENWYRIKVPKDMDIIESLKYISKIDSRKIVIRGYDFIDFTPTIFNEFNPNKKLNNSDILRHYFKIKHISFVRTSFDVYRSMITSSHKIQDPDFIFYHEYIKKLLKIKIKVFYYEELCKNPLSEVKRLFDYIGLGFKPLFLEKLNNEKVLGDVLSNNRSRGYSKTEILTLENKVILEELSPKLKNMFIKIDKNIASFSFL